ncbi:hypothetical protein CR513_15912, partial [Mucuna pruriens]
YKYNEDIALNQSRLQNLSKIESEEFKDYAQRWHELATQVQPPPPPGSRKRWSLWSVASSFADLVTPGIKRGKFAQANNSISFVKKAGQEKKKKGETNAVLIDPSNPYG